MLKILLVFLCIFCLTACYEPQEGCLDPNAVNYDVSADINANCTYPQLAVSFAHKWGNASFSYDSIYLDENGDAFQIRFMGFFLRNFEVEVEGVFVAVSDKINSVQLGNGMRLQYPEEIVFVESRNFNASIDSVTVFEPWSALQARIGLEALSEVDSASLPSGHPLNKRDAMSQGNFYYDYVVSILPDTSDINSQRWIYSSIDQTQLLNFMHQGMFEPGMNSDLIFDLFYDRLFEGFEKNMTDEDIRTMWEGNIGSSIDLRE